MLSSSGGNFVWVPITIVIYRFIATNKTRNTLLWMKRSIFLKRENFDSQELLEVLG